MSLKWKPMISWYRIRVTKIKKIMRKLFITLAAALIILGLTGCEDNTNILFDTPFVSITGEDGNSSSEQIQNKNDGYLSTLIVRVCASDNFFKEALTVDYELICGDGLKEGVDFTLQKSTSSPLKFDKGVYKMPVRIRWNTNKNFDPTKDNTLVIRLTGCSVPDMEIGYPGPDKIHSSFTFKKI